MRHPIVVIGAGQAGLAASFWLRQHGNEHVVLERSAVGSTWRARRWDSFRLVTPNWMVRLPGAPYVGNEAGGFLGRDEVVQQLEACAASFDAPVEAGVDVHALHAEAGGFRLETSRGTRHASAVVVATGTFHRQRRPAWATALPPTILQIGALDYRRPDALPAGAILVVGSGQSGVQIADELARAGRRVFLATGRTPRLPRRHRGRDLMEWLVAAGVFDQTVSAHPLGEAVRRRPNAHVAGGQTIDLRRLGARGVRLLGRATGALGARIAFAPDLAANLAAADRGALEFQATADRYIEACREPASDEREMPFAWSPGAEVDTLDLRRERVSAVIWATGLAPDFSWIRCPVLDAHGYPRTVRGLTEVPGLSFVGLHWMHRWSSGLLYGVGRDARHVVERLTARDRNSRFSTVSEGGVS